MYSTWAYMARRIILDLFMYVIILRKVKESSRDLNGPHKAKRIFTTIRKNICVVGSAPESVPAPAFDRLRNRPFFSPQN